MSIKIDLAQLISVLRLKEVLEQTIPLKITGRLKKEFDYKPFVGMDCIRVSK